MSKQCQRRSRSSRGCGIDITDNTSTCILSAVEVCDGWGTEGAVREVRGEAIGDSAEGGITGLAEGSEDAGAGVSTIGEASLDCSLESCVPLYAIMMGSSSAKIGSSFGGEGSKIIGGES